MLRTEHLQAFVAVAEAGSITEAAARLALSKSVVSERLAALEDELGVRLLQRSTRRMRLTSDGEALLARARRIIDELEEARGTIGRGSGALKGRLRIAAPMTFGRLYVAPVVRAFAALHPGIDIALDLDDRRVDVVGEGYDLAVRVGALGDSALVARKIAESRSVLVAAPAYLAAAGSPRGLAELAAHEAVLYSNLPNPYEWSFDTGGRTRTVRVGGRLMINNGEVVRDAAIDGAGLAVLPMFIVCEALAAGTLVVVDAGAAPPTTPISVLMPEARLLPLRTRALVDTLVEAFAGTPPWERI